MCVTIPYLQLPSPIRSGIKITPKEDEEFIILERRLAERSECVVIAPVTSLRTTEKIRQYQQALRENRVVFCEYSERADKAIWFNYHQVLAHPKATFSTGGKLAEITTVLLLKLVFKGKGGSESKDKVEYFHFTNRVKWSAHSDKLYRDIMQKHRAAQKNQVEKLKKDGKLNAEAFKGKTSALDVLKAIEGLSILSKVESQSTLKEVEGTGLIDRVSVSSMQSASASVPSLQTIPAINKTISSVTTSSNASQISSASGFIASSLSVVTSVETRLPSIRTDKEIVPKSGDIFFILTEERQETEDKELVILHSVFSLNTIDRIRAYQQALKEGTIVFCEQNDQTIELKRHKKWAHALIRDFSSKGRQIAGIVSKTKDGAEEINLLSELESTIQLHQKAGRSPNITIDGKKLSTQGLTIGQALSKDEANIWRSASDTAHLILYEKWLKENQYLQIQVLLKCNQQFFNFVNNVVLSSVTDDVYKRLCSQEENRVNEAIAALTTSTLTATVPAVSNN